MCPAPTCAVEKQLVTGDICQIKCASWSTDCVQSASICTAGLCAQKVTQSGRETDHFHPVPRLRIRGAVLPLPPPVCFGVQSGCLYGIQLRSHTEFNGRNCDWQSIRWCQLNELLSVDDIQEWVLCFIIALIVSSDVSNDELLQGNYLLLPQYIFVR